MLEAVKLALRISTTLFDSELTTLINAAKMDLGIAGVEVPSQTNDLITRAVITFCKFNFGTPSDVEYERLKKSYDEQKAQLSMATGYTSWNE